MSFGLPPITEIGQQKVSFCPCEVNQLIGAPITQEAAHLLSLKGRFFFPWPPWQMGRIAH